MGNMRKTVIPVLALTLLTLVPKNASAIQAPRVDLGKNQKWASFLGATSESPGSNKMHIRGKSKLTADHKSLFSKKIGNTRILVTNNQLSFTVENIGLSGTHDLSKDPPVLVQLSPDEKYVFMVLESGKIFVFSLETFSKSLNGFLPEDSKLQDSLKDPNLRVFKVGDWFCLISSIPETSAIWARWSKENKFEYTYETVGVSLEGAEFEVGKDSLTIITPDKKSFVIFSP